MTEAITWFYAIVGSGVVNAFVTFFIQKFLIKPTDRKIDELISVFKKYLSQKEEYPDVEKNFLRGKK